MLIFEIDRKPFVIGSTADRFSFGLSIAIEKPQKQTLIIH